MEHDIDLKSLRSQLGMSRADLAGQAGVDVSTICRWENDGVPKRGPARAFLDRLVVEAASKPADEVRAVA